MLFNDPCIRFVSAQTAVDTLQRHPDAGPSWELKCVLYLFLYYGPAIVHIVRQLRDQLRHPYCRPSHGTPVWESITVSDEWITLLADRCIVLPVDIQSMVTFLTRTCVLTYSWPDHHLYGGGWYTWTSGCSNLTQPNERFPSRNSILTQLLPILPDPHPCRLVVRYLGDVNAHDREQWNGTIDVVSPTASQRVLIQPIVETGHRCPSVNSPVQTRLIVRSTCSWLQPPQGSADRLDWDTHHRVEQPFTPHDRARGISQWWDWSLSLIVVRHFLFQHSQSWMSSSSKSILPTSSDRQPGLANCQHQLRRWYQRWMSTRWDGHRRPFTDPTWRDPISWIRQCLRGHSGSTSAEWFDQWQAWIVKHIQVVNDHEDQDEFNQDNVDEETDDDDKDSAMETIGEGSGAMTRSINVVAGGTAAAATGPTGAVVESGARPAVVAAAIGADADAAAVTVEMGNAAVAVPTRVVLTEPIVAADGRGGRA